jgi:hypothetical protein
MFPAELNLCRRQLACTAMHCHALCHALPCTVKSEHCQLTDCMTPVGRPPMNSYGQLSESNNANTSHSVDETEHLGPHGLQGNEVGWCT